MVHIVKSFIPGVSRVISNATPIIILFIFSKFLIPEELGVLNYFISLITLIGIFTDFGLSEAVQRYLPKNKSPRLIFSTLLMELGLVIGVGLLILVIDLLTGNRISRGYPIQIFLIILFSACNIIILIFNGLKDKLRTSTYFLFTSLTFLAITFGLYFLNITDAVNSFLIGRLISWIIFTIIPIIDLLRKNLIEVKFELPHKYVSFFVNNMIVDFSYSLFNQWDSILIINVLGEFQNGIYKSVSFIASIPYIVSVVLQTKLLPEYSEFFHDNEVQKVKISFDFLNKLLILGGIIIVFLSIILGHLGLSIIYNSEIADLGTQYLPFIIAAVMIYIASVPSTTVLLANGKDHIVRNLSLVQSIGFVALSSLLLSTLGLSILPLILIVLNSIFFFISFIEARKEFRQ